MSLLEAQSLSKTFTPDQSLAKQASRRLRQIAGQALEALPAVHAVNEVSLSVKPGEVLGIVGESGCGKSTLGRMLAGILKPSSGLVSYNDLPVMDTESREGRKLRTDIQFVFQDPFASLNPRHRIERIITEGAVQHGLIEASQARAYASELLEQVGVDPSFASRYPHQFSGGQRQRIGIARALSMKPRVLICDEAVAALDVSIQAQVINLFMALKEKHKLTYVFISHGLSVVRHISDRVAIMYLGKVVEIASAHDIYSNPQHPYTKALLANRLSIRGERQVFTPIQGEIPSPLNPPRGCHFHPRCPIAQEQCKAQAPALKKISVSMDRSHEVSCHLVSAP